ncbi:protein of unknown function DUF29 [Gloeothece citriformis PCC 7424]|uniref:DUF29 domain-containing protein n=1 Tax=Gloeothece citriformis (strain PCC 7424) TaxID=65393 RepID=B7K7X2_GLOC7|nr:DUF29 domain-containing protein [Gloeothece citriformis]ACK71168.1 protein of unknown function DUF29 [Gloeothece citriformis PCC 7424]
MNPLPLSDQIKSNLSKKDLYLWLKITVQLLREHKFDQVDYDRLIEEIEGMAKNEKNRLKSHLEKLLIQLLKWKYQPSEQVNLDKYLISEHSLRLLETFEDSPSLKDYFKEILPECYQNSRLLASKETGLTVETFPENCPFSVEDILNPNYILKESDEYP